MGFSDEDKILIKNKTVPEILRQKKLMKEFPEKGWSKSELSCSETSEKSMV